MKNVHTVTLKSGPRIGLGEPCFIVAEVGNNHQGDFNLAVQMVETAARMGVHAVKFQKRDMDAMFTTAGKNAPYTGKNSFGSTYGEHRLALELSFEEMAKLKQLTESLGLVFFTSAWDSVSLEQMLSLDVELLKICSADLVNIPALRQAGRTGIPVILSTGMSTLTDIDRAVGELRQFHDDIILLHCNSSYPCPETDIALPCIKTLKQRYGLPVGYSGHEQGLGPSVAAAALGACVIERHFTLDKTMCGTDHQVSLDPKEFETLVTMVREVGQAMQVTGKKVYSQERAAANKLRKSIVFARNLPAGHVISESDLTVKCPGAGVSPLQWDEVVGSILNVGVTVETPLRWEMLVTADKTESPKEASL